MKNTIKLIAACAIATGASGAFASGSHAGGHGESSIGKAGVASKATRTIAIAMNDTMRYTPSDIKVRKGETVRLVVTNAGQLKHELSLGTVADLKAHQAMMKKFPGMAHDEPNQVSLEPGKSGEIIWQFTQAGTVSFACLLPGHYEAGMQGTVKVSAKP
jgi:uncharacterized cupredoxin-like copper-binding protein